MITNDDKMNFDKAIESLRQYQRYQLIDEENRDLLDRLYIDPLDNNSILNLSLKENTTVLVGRKGTGKSTIFMRMQNELRKRDDIISCYIDVKDIFDKAKKNYTTITYLGIDEQKQREIYSIQRKFVMDFIDELIKEIEKSYTKLWDKIKSKVGLSRPDKAISELKEIRQRILDNKHLQNIELETISKVNVIDKVSYLEDTNFELGSQLGAKINPVTPQVEAGVNGKMGHKNSSVEENEKAYNRVFAKIFEITEIIDKIKNILAEMKLRKLFIILDDYSEIDQTALKMFCDLIVNTLNNNSDNFIKFKISAYPGRVELGELDLQKIDIRYLDYYQLYNFDKRSDMETAAIDYTRRILENRLEVYTKKTMEYFFDTTKTSKDEYYKVLFQMTLNVVRHLGLILDYAADISIAQGKKITLSNLYDSSRKFYTERLKVFFRESQATLMTYDDRIERFHLEELLDVIINKSKKNKSDIRTNKYTAIIFNEVRKNPYCSHFYILLEYEKIISSLELNFFISKYNQMTSKNGKKVSIYALNYGLAMVENLRWGKPEGNSYRTYFIESPFNFNNVIDNFINSSKCIKCSSCGFVFDSKDLPTIERFGMNCFKCGAQNSVIVNPLSDSYKDLIRKIEKENKLLEKEHFMYMNIIALKDKDVTPIEMAKELDVTRQKIGWMSKKLREDYKYIERVFIGTQVYYRITQLGKDMFLEII